MPRNSSKSKPASVSLAERISRLSRKRQEIIRPVQEHPRDYVLLSVRDVAAHLHTDPATVVRIVRGLGFTGYREFKRYLHEVSIAQATSLEEMQSAVATDSTPVGQVRKLLDLDLKNLQGLRNTLDARRVVALAKRLHSARRIVILGGDLARTLVLFLEYTLRVLGLPAISAVTPGETTHIARLIGKGDLVIAISFQRGLRQTVEGLRQARANGAYCVGITNTWVSPIARFSHECFLTAVEGSFTFSYAAPMALLNALLGACAGHRRQATLKLLKQVDEEQRHGYRWYRD